MNKRATAGVYRRGIELLREAGILSHASFIIGFPGRRTIPSSRRSTLSREQLRTFFQGAALVL